jgi:hypothetical protein
MECFKRWGWLKSPVRGPERMALVLSFFSLFCKNFFLYFHPPVYGGPVDEGGANADGGRIPVDISGPDVVFLIFLRERKGRGDFGAARRHI